MTDQYFQVRQNNQPNSKGLVLKKSGYYLEMFVGEGLPIEYGFSINEYGKLFVGSSYSFALIGKKNST